MSEYGNLVLSRLAERNIVPDKDQNKAIYAVDELLKKRGFFSKGSSMSGVYIWGLPGRGKSSLMDACLGAYEGTKIRLHFHEFLRSIIKLLSGKEEKSQDELMDKWLSPYKLICFDEFHVHDIGDTMLVLRFLQRVVQKKHKLILTSNYEPDQLQPDPLFHAHFQPAIDIINEKFTVIPFTFEYDYRTLNGTPSENSLFHYPITEDKHAKVVDVLKKADPSFKEEEGEIRLSNRPFKTFALGEKTVGMRFEDLCMAASSYIDYLELTERWNTLFLSDIHEDFFNHRHSMQRFIWLLDVLYDRRIKLYTTSEKPLISMIEESPAMKDVERTISRLYEMQSIYS